MSDTSSSMAQWAGLYHQGPGPGPGPGPVPVPADSTAITTAAATSSTGPRRSPARPQPGIEGRVGKPARRRPRASRRAPVTLLNTDAANFRAMVQQFTGVPPGAYPAPGGPVINFAADYGLPVRPSQAAVMSFDQLHPPPLQDHFLRPQQHHHYNEIMAGSFVHGAHGHGFESAEDSMILQSLHAAQMLPRPAATNNRNGYSFG